MDRSEPPTKKRRTEAPVKEEPIPLKEEETELAELSQLLGGIRNLTRRKDGLARILDETLTETYKLKTRLDYLWVLHFLRAENPIFKSSSILISPSQATAGEVKVPQEACE